MSKKIKFLAAALSAVIGFGVVQMNNEAKAAPAYGCKYTGMYESRCYYGGYMIYNCQFGSYTTCGYYPSPVIR